MVVLTAIVGYLIAVSGRPDLMELLWLTSGTALSAFGANILNQVLEADRDRLMERTRSRPIPSERVGPAVAAVWGIASAGVGVMVLAVGTNLLTAALSLGVIVLYVAVYTPLKVRTAFNTIVGAVCGAVPPMMGWAAASGRLDLGAWILGAILFVWQVPHFLALAWLYRADYRRGGFRMVPELDDHGPVTGRLAFLYAVALLPVTAALWLSGASGPLFLIGSQALGVALATLGWRFLRLRSDRAARRLFLATIIYLPVLLGLMVSDLGGAPTFRKSVVSSTPHSEASPPFGAST
jgi:protoheme IX farnesyltransferase